MLVKSDLPLTMASLVNRSNSTEEVGEALRFCLVQLQQETTPSQLSQAVQILIKIFRNVQRNPTDDKYRSLKTENKTFHDRVWQFDIAQQFLIATGWAEVDGVVRLLEDRFIETALMTLEETFGEISSSENTCNAQPSQASSAAYHKSERELQLDEARKRQYEAMRREKEEKRRIAEMIKADRRETNTRESKDSNAKPRTFGSNVKRFEDIGVDLNKGGG